VPNHADFIPDIPDHPLPRGSRPKSYPAAQVLPSWPEPDFTAFQTIKTPQRSLNPPLHPDGRLGVLPSPARSAFAQEVSPYSAITTPHDDIVESVVRYAPVTSPLVEDERTPTQASTLSQSDGLLTPRAPNRMSNHQRVVSLLQPEEIIADDGKEEPVSPISPEDEDASFPVEMKPTVATTKVIPSEVPQKANEKNSTVDINQSAVLEDAGLSISPADQPSISEELEEHHSTTHRSRSSTDTWEKVSNPGTDPHSAIDDTSIQDSSSIASEPVKSVSEPKGKQRATTPPVDQNVSSQPAEAVHHSPNQSAGSAVLGQAQVMQLKNVNIASVPQAGTPPRVVSEVAKTTSTLPQAPRRFMDHADRLSEIALAHKKMRDTLDQLSPTSPPDFGATDAAGRKFDTDRASMYAPSERLSSMRAASFITGSDRLSLKAGSDRTSSLSAASFRPGSDRISVVPGSANAFAHPSSVTEPSVVSSPLAGSESPSSTFKLERHGPAQKGPESATAVTPEPSNSPPQPPISPPEPTISPPSAITSSRGPIMTVTKPEVSPELDPVDHSARSGETIGPPLSIATRSMPSVSSMDHDTNPSATQSPISHVSSVKTAFENREYHPPDPNKERPMSFVPLPRDPSGLPQQEVISTAKHPVDPVSPTVTQERRPSLPSGAPQRRSRQLSLQMESSDLYDPPSPKRERNAPKRELSLLQTSAPPVQSQQRPPPEHQTARSPVQGRNVTGLSPSSSQMPPGPPSHFQGMQDIHNQTFRREAMDPRQHTSEYQLPGIGPLPVGPPGGGPGGNRFSKKPGVLQKLKGRSTPVPEPPRSSPPRINPQYVASPESQRMQSFTSTIASQDIPENKDKKKARGSNIFSGFKRPPSPSAESTLTGVSGDASSIRADADESPTRGPHLQVPGIPTFTIPPSPQDAPQKKTSGANAKNKHLQRATTHTGEQPSKKKRFSALGSLFGRSGTTGHTTNNKKLNKEPPRSTVIHHVPDNPSAFTAMQQQYHLAQQGSQNQGNRSAPVPMLPHQVDVQPPPGGYYAPANNPAFGHVQGATGFVAIANQQRNPSASSATSSAGKDKRSGSNTSSHWPLFGRRSSTGSSGGHLSPQISATSPADRFRQDSLGAPSISPVSTRRDSSPGGQPIYVRGPPPRGMRMGSITEGMPGQHQERPWALTLPGADEDDSDITRQEIFHAASARWQRGPDGLMYAIPRDVASPTTPQSQNFVSPTTISPQLPVHAQGSPANPVYSYLPTQVHSSPPPPSRSPGHKVGQFQSQQTVIPPLPQSQVQLLQPQPQRPSYPPVSVPNSSTVASRSPPLHDPRLSPSYQSRGASSAPAPPPKLPLHDLVTVHTSTTTTTTTSTNTDESPQTIIKSPSSASNGPAQKTPISAVPSSAYSQSTAPPLLLPAQEESESPPPPPPPAKDSPTTRSPPNPVGLGGPVGGSASSVIGPIPGGAMGSSTRSMQAAMQQRHQRQHSEDSEGDQPVMKAVSYPGDEWMPRWDLLE
jgi:hypothetical protein